MGSHVDIHRFTLFLINAAAVRVNLNRRIFTGAAGGK